MKQILEIEVADYLNGDWKPNWNDKIQTKYFITYNYDDKRFEINSRYYMNSGLICFSSIENVLKAIEIIGEEELIQLFSL